MPKKYKISSEQVKEITQARETITVRLMFQDEAGFGRINKPKYYCCEKGERPCVLCHHIREYRYVYGAVEPLTRGSYLRA